MSKSRSAIVRLQLIHTERIDLLRNAKERVVSGLSPEGVALLDAHIQAKVKRQIKVFRAGSMNQPQ